MLKVKEAFVAIRSELATTTPGDYLAHMVQTMLEANVQYVMRDSVRDDEQLEILNLIDRRAHYLQALSMFNPWSGVTTFGVLIPGQALKDPYYLPYNDPKDPSFGEHIGLRGYSTTDANVVVKNQLDNLLRPVIKLQRIYPSLNGLTNPNSPPVIQMTADLAKLSIAEPIRPMTNLIHEQLDKIRTD